MVDLYLPRCDIVVAPRFMFDDIRLGHVASKKSEMSEGLRI